MKRKGIQLLRPIQCQYSCTQLLFNQNLSNNQSKNTYKNRKHANLTIKIPSKTSNAAIIKVKKKKIIKTILSQEKKNPYVFYNIQQLRLCLVAKTLARKRSFKSPTLQLLYIFSTTKQSMEMEMEMIYRREYEN